MKITDEKGTPLLSALGGDEGGGRGGRGGRGAAEE